MNEVIEAMRKRRSVRAYTEEVPSDELVERVVDAGLWAASGRGRQSPIVLAVTDRALRDRLSAMNARIMGAPEGTDPFYGAPVVLVVLADRSVPTHVYDGSLVMGNLMLAAHELGLGSCWIHRAREEFDTPEGRQILADLGVEGDYEGVGHCILGYAAEVPEPKPRREGRLVWAR
ncbi:nitroreductase family protein [Olsenella sp. An188]|uniref:nitroreductase family protein n=1 Tax=Olsenella sp. An188 TaxID=1965579 RepID=UPI000B3AE7C9|nr:nitroreductase [Olsenella sp. An188]OUP37798.1 diguanylate cyclase [Olsenella sp. An188]